MKLAVQKIMFAVVLVSASVVSFSAFAAGDAAAGKGKAALCAGCHGADGMSMSPDIPNLAGQKEAYL
ncbi:MAG: cytochrome c, partial [Gammaproteobacteria bacterium]|nr:cytochrome c [Gammaproteobacteria bacterium]